jgi:hypothetical protein
MESLKLNKEQGQELCDEIANMLLNTIEAQDIDNKIDAAVNVFLTEQKLKGNTEDLARKLSWSVTVKLEE